MKISYNWLKWYIPEVINAEKLQDIFTYHLTEVEGVEKLADGDVVFDLNILPNRAHDLLSHYGVAKEISGQLGITFTDPAKSYEDILAKKEIQRTNVIIDLQTTGCRRYMARIVRNIKVGPSPDWVVKHLESIGQRSINNIVDATNLVMFNCGNPVHAYDLKKLANNKAQEYGVVVKTAQENEELELVGRDKIIAKLKNTDVIITNSSGETLGLAGIKGGTNSGIVDDTTDILLEVANFDPIFVRKTARRIGVLSDAAKRFENNLSPELCNAAMLELTALLVEMFPDAVVEEIIDVYPNKQESRAIEFSLSQINTILGSQISREEVETILRNYSFSYTSSENFPDYVFTVVVPPLRLDLVGSHDIVEEIGRIYGYNKIIPVIPKINFTPQENSTYSQILSVRKKLTDAGYRETMTYTFAKKGDIEVARGLKGKDALRTNLYEALKESYEMNRLNAPILGQSVIKLFEIGTVFVNGNEEIHVGVADNDGVEEMELKNFVVNRLEFIADTVSPRAEKLDAAPITEFAPWSPYPYIVRDIALWVPREVESSTIYKIIKDNAGEYLVTGPTLFDTFSKEDYTSYAFRLVFQSKDRTLTDEEITQAMEKINQHLLKINSVKLR